MAEADHYSGLEAAAGNLLRVILGVKVGAQAAPASPTARQVAKVQKQRCVLRSLRPSTTTLRSMPKKCLKKSFPTRFLGL